ncbi:MAG: hypothetical protein J7L78_03370, partial [Dehalococcoidales bacterium]|nr:hypothetical protein [Dehalococcoidales bacterium]
TVITPSMQNSTPRIEIITATHKYVMGDNDSKNDARRMCFLEANRRLLEKAGTYIQSHTEIRNFQLTKDEISAYTAALLKVDVVKEEWKVVGENMAILMSVKAEVDTSYIQNQLYKIKQDASIQKKIKDQQNQLQDLERKIAKLQNKLVLADQSVAIPLREQRITAFGEINKIQARYAFVLSFLNDRRAASVEQAKLILSHIEIDMTQKEVEYVLGKPDETGEDRWHYFKPYMVYGRFIIYLSRLGSVEEICFRQSDGRLRIIKDRTYNILIHGITERRPRHCYDDCKLELNDYVLGK